MKRIQIQLKVTEKQANEIISLVKEVREKREDYTSCLKDELKLVSTYKNLTDAEVIIMSLKNQLQEEKWNILKIVGYAED